MVNWRRVIIVAMAIGPTSLLGLPLDAQAVAPPPDTASARRVVDSLIRVGAWSAPKPQNPDTVRLPAVAVPSEPSAIDQALHVAAMLAGTAIIFGLGALTILFSVRFLAALNGRFTVGMRGHWGGFGGNESGWEISPALTLLGLTIAFAILTTVVASTLLNVGKSDEPEGASASAPAAATSPAATARK